jgi:hypothetical protein
MESALALARLDAYVFPVDHPELPHCAGIGRDHDPQTCRERGKHPAVKFTERSTTDPQVIAAWFAGSTYNVGVHCGPSGLLVVDEDHPGEFQRFADERGRAIPPTFTVSTGKGAHFYFRTNGQAYGNAEGAFGSYDINIPAGNAYVVAPSSLHASGVRYAVTDPLPPAPLPSWIADALGQRGPTEPPRGQGEPRGLDAVPAVIRGPRDDSGGERHNVLMQYASSLRARSIPPAEAEPLFRLAWQRCEQPPACRTPQTWEDARAILEDVYARYPEGASTDQSEPDSLVAHELRMLRVRYEARRIFDAERRGPMPPFDAARSARSWPGHRGHRAGSPASFRGMRTR